MDVRFWGRYICQEKIVQCTKEYKYIIHRTNVGISKESDVPYGCSFLRLKKDLEYGL